MIASAASAPSVSMTARSPSMTPPPYVSSSSVTWWWNNIVLKYNGIPTTSPTKCIQSGQSGFAVQLAQTIVSAFGISPYRICNPTLTPVTVNDGNNVDISSIKFSFYINDIRPALSLANDYLPASCAGPWIVSWLSNATNFVSPQNAVVPPTSAIPLNFQSPSCTPLVPGAPAPTLYFTNVDKETPKYIEDLKTIFRQKFAPTSFLSVLFTSKNLEQLTGVTGASVQLAGSASTGYATSKTLTDYLVKYSYPLSFIGAILFTVTQIVDINIPSVIGNKNISMALNVSFITWSVVAMSVFFNIQLSSIPILGAIITSDVPYVLPLNTQTVVTQA
jgi:hypothetical protein